MRALFPLLFLLVIGLAVPAGAETARVAVAANFAGAAEALRARFEAGSPHRVVLILGATGQHYAQIRQGAPMDLFLAADQARPARLEAEGAVASGGRFTYATGRLALWRSGPAPVGDGAALLRSGRFERLAIANPRLAPYGAAAMDALEALGAREAAADKLVYGENVGQAFGLAAAGGADLALIALSQAQAAGRGTYWIAPAGSHRPIRQDAALLARGAENPAARAFFAFLKSAEAAALIRAQGYGDGAGEAVGGGADAGARSGGGSGRGFDFGALWLSFQLAGATTLALLLTGGPLAWWLATTRSRLKPLVETVAALPLVLPPTVLGFYLLILLSPNGALGGAWVSVSGGALTFSFAGLVVASMAYSLPFTVQPLQTAFEAIGPRPREAAATLGAGPLDAFFSVVAPMAGRGFLSAAVLTFAHTVGEFGVVLMVGGAIPGETRTVSIAIYEQVETLDYAAAHTLSAVLLGFSCAVLLAVYGLNRRFPIHLD